MVIGERRGGGGCSALWGLGWWRHEAMKGTGLAPMDTVGTKDSVGTHMMHKPTYRTDMDKDLKNW